MEWPFSEAEGYKNYVPAERFEQFKSEFNALKMGQMGQIYLPIENLESWALEIANQKILELEEALEEARFSEEQHGLNYIAYEEQIERLKTQSEREASGNCWWLGYTPNEDGKK